MEQRKGMFESVANAELVVDWNAHARQLPRQLENWIFLVKNAKWLYQSTFN